MSGSVVLLVHPSPKFWAYSERADGCHIWFGGLRETSGMSHEKKSVGYGATTASTKRSSGKKGGPYTEAGAIEEREWEKALPTLQWLVGKTDTFPKELKADTKSVLVNALQLSGLDTNAQTSQRINQMMNSSFTGVPQPQMPAAVPVPLYIVSDPSVPSEFDFIV